MFKNLLLRSSGRGSASPARTGAAIATAAVLALGLAACGSASGNTSSSSDGASSGSKTIRVGYETGQPGVFINSFAEEVFTEMGYKVEMIPMEFKALIPSLQSGRIDAAGGGLFITPPRCQTVAFSEPGLYFLHAFAVPKGNTNNLKTFEDVAKTGVKLGVPTGSDEGRQAKAAGVQESQISTYQDISTALDAVQTGRVDVVSYDNVTLGMQLAKPAYSGLGMTEPTNPTFDDGQKRPYAAGIAFPKKDSELAKQYSEKQAELFKEGTKAAEIAKKDAVPADSIPKAGDTFTTADYCAHAGS